MDHRTKALSNTSASPDAVLGGTPGKASFVFWICSFRPQALSCSRRSWR